jgi:lysophospholipase L1-like esterase
MTKIKISIPVLKKKLIYLFVNFIVIILVLEILSRIFFHNEYSQNRKNYLHQPNKNINFKIDKLYDNSPAEIIFKTDNLGGIINKYDEENIVNYEIVAFGGSTLESALVPFGFRWNDLTDFKVKNYGKSRLMSAQNLVNLEYVLDKKKVQTVFIMDSVNNFYYFLNKQSSNNKNNPENLKDKILSNFYFLSIIYNFVKKNNYNKFYEIQNKIFENKKNITQKEIDFFWNKNLKELLLFEKQIIKDYLILGRKHQVEIIFILQPHGYNNSYSQNANLITNFVIDNKKLSQEQSLKLINNYYEILINLYNNFNVNHFDAETCIAKKKLTDLFYDRLHFTKKGSKMFANCLDDYVKKTKLM